VHATVCLCREEKRRPEIDATSPPDHTRPGRVHRSAVGRQRGGSGHGDGGGSRAPHPGSPPRILVFTLGTIPSRSKSTASPSLRPSASPICPSSELTREAEKCEFCRCHQTPLLRLSTRRQTLISETRQPQEAEEEREKPLEFGTLWHPQAPPKASSTRSAASVMYSPRAPLALGDPNKLVNPFNRSSSCAELNLLCPPCRRG